MDVILPIFFKAGIFTIGFLFVFITIIRFTKPASLKLLKSLQDISKNKLFRKFFFAIGGLLGLVIGLALSGVSIIAGLSGLLSGVVYFGLIFAVISMLYEYMKEDEV